MNLFSSWDDQWDAQVRLYCPRQVKGEGTSHRFVRRGRHLLHFTKHGRGLHSKMLPVESEVLGSWDEAELTFRTWIDTLIMQGWKPYSGAQLNAIREEFSARLTFPKVADDAYLPYW